MKDIDKKIQIDKDALETQYFLPETNDKIEIPKTTKPSDENVPQPDKRGTAEPTSPPPNEPFE